MKRKYLVAPLLLSIILSACNGKAKNDFIPKLDTDTKGSITIAGNYANFEALEIEFDEFQKYYPNIQLQYSFFQFFPPYCLCNYPWSWGLLPWWSCYSW